MKQLFVQILVVVATILERLNFLNEVFLSNHLMKLIIEMIVVEKVSSSMEIRGGSVGPNWED